MTRNNSTKLRSADELPKLRDVKKKPIMSNIDPKNSVPKRAPRYKASSPLNKGADFEEHLKQVFERIRY
jgi:hypothetical protein